MRGFISRRSLNRTAPSIVRKATIATAVIFVDFTLRFFGVGVGEIGVGVGVGACVGGRGRELAACSSG